MDKKELTSTAASLSGGNCGSTGGIIGNGAGDHHHHDGHYHSHELGGSDGSEGRSRSAYGETAGTTTDQEGGASMYTATAAASDDGGDEEFLMDLVRSRATREGGGGGGNSESTNEDQQSEKVEDEDNVEDKKICAKMIMMMAASLDDQQNSSMTMNATAPPPSTDASGAIAHQKKKMEAPPPGSSSCCCLTPAVASYPPKYASADATTTCSTDTTSGKSPHKSQRDEDQGKNGSCRSCRLGEEEPHRSTSGTISLPGAFAQTPSQREGFGENSGRILDHYNNNNNNNNNNDDDDDDLAADSTPTRTTGTQQAGPAVIGRTDSSEQVTGNNNRMLNAGSVHSPSAAAAFAFRNHNPGMASMDTFTGLSSMDNSALLAAELVPQYEQADILQQDVILLSPQEKENMAHCKKRLVILIATLIGFVGTAASIAFMTLGITKALEEQDVKFEDAAQESIQNIQDAFEEYVNAVASVHTRCRKRDFTRQDFRDLYETLIEQGLQFKAVQFYPNTTHAERPAREADSRSFYARHYPRVDYRGFVGFNELDGSGGLQPRQEEPWYFPVHYMEPIKGNEAAIDLDYHSSEVRIRAVDAVFKNAKPSLSDRLNLVKEKGQVSRCGNHNGPSYGVVLTHPGINLTRHNSPTSSLGNLDDYDFEAEDADLKERPPVYNASHPDVGFVDDVWPRDLAAMVVCIPDLLTRSMAHHHNHDFQNKAIYIHDLNHLSPHPVFMGGARFHAPSNSQDNRPAAAAAAAAATSSSTANDDAGEAGVGAAALGVDPTFLDEAPLEELKSPSQFQQLKYQGTVKVANRIWTVTVVAIKGTYKPQYMFVLVGGLIIFVGTLLVASWVYRMSNSTSSDQEEQEETRTRKNKRNQEGLLHRHGGGSSTAAMWTEEDQA